MNCPRCNWPNVSRRCDGNVEHHDCLRFGCDWHETVPAAGQKRAHRPLPGGNTGRLRAVLKWAKDLGW